jgi:hypothetical protein
LREFRMASLSIPREIFMSVAMPRTTFIESLLIGP